MSSGFGVHTLAAFRYTSKRIGESGRPKRGLDGVCREPQSKEPVSHGCRGAPAVLHVCAEPSMGTPATSSQCPLLQEQPHSQPAGRAWRALSSTATVQHTAHVPVSLQPSRLDSCMQEPPLVQECCSDIGRNPGWLDLHREKAGALTVTPAVLPSLAEPATHVLPVPQTGQAQSTSELLYWQLHFPDYLLMITSHLSPVGRLAHLCRPAAFIPSPQPLTLL